MIKEAYNAGEQAMAVDPWFLDFTQRATPRPRDLMPSQDGELPATLSERLERLRRAVDTWWPYQVALPADACTGAQYDVVHNFCRGLSLCARGHYFRHDDIGYNVFCFALKEHAEMFREKFGGDVVEATRSR